MREDKLPKYNSARTKVRPEFAISENKWADEISGNEQPNKKIKRQASK